MKYTSTAFLAAGLALRRLVPSGTYGFLRVERFRGT
jgi:hypothetical protein